MVHIFSISSYDHISSLWQHNQNETLNLEFKRELSSNSSEIAKDVSSFANAEGGIIIYGMDEENGKAVESNGVETGQNSERIQQIISSSTSPNVPLEIVQIDLPTNENSTPTREFLVVKIPKSRFMIHQVSTKSKYYIRNNTITTSHIYEPMEMKENEIALRYENRFRAKKDQIDFLIEKERQIARELNWGSYVLISVVPHVRIPDSIKITRDSFRNFFVSEQSHVIYNDLGGVSGTSIPNYDGRSSDPHTSERDYFEIDNDRSIHFCRIIGGGHRITMYHPMFASGPMLHLANRILTETGYYGGATFRMSVNGSIATDSEVGYTEIPTGGRTVADFEIQHELPYSPINVKDEFSKIFEKYFQALHIDNSLEIYSDSTISRVFLELDASESRLNQENS